MDVLLLICSILLLVLGLYVLPSAFRALRRHYILLAVPEPVPGHWLLGHIVYYRELEKAIQRWQNWLSRLPRMQRTRIGPSIMINLSHPETASVVLKRAEPKNDAFYRFLKPWLGNGLLVSGGKRWARDRRLLTQGFHFNILRNYVEVYHIAANTLLEKWAKECQLDREQTVAVNVTQSSTLLTLDVILRCIMSYESDCQNPQSQGEAVKYAKAVHEVARLLAERFLNLVLHNDFVFRLSACGRRFYALRNLCHKVSQQIITQRRAALAEVPDGDCGEKDSLKEHLTSGKRKYLDFLDILLMVRDEDGSGLSDKEIQDQVDTFMFAGHDTTASAMQWSLYFLAKHPDLQERCRREVREVAGETGHINFEHLNQFVYLTQFIKEALRLSSTVPFIQRTLTQDTIIDGYNLPAGTSVSVPIIALHHNPTVWEDPLRFDPERFSPEQSAKRNPFAFVPFSAGPRNCIGQSLAFDELRTVLALVLMRFRLSEDTNHPDPHFIAFLVARSVEDIHVRIQELCD